MRLKSELKNATIYITAIFSLVDIFYKISSFLFSSKIVNSEQTIHTNFLKIDSNELLKILKKKLKSTV